MRTIKIICSSSSCKHRNGNGYYGVCNHPTSKQIVPYNGITQFYVDKCDLMERERRAKGATDDRNDW